MRSVYKAAKYTNDEKFDAVLREAASGLDFETLHRRLTETGKEYTDNGLTDVLNYLMQHGFMSEETKDYTTEIITGISGRSELKNLASCSACGKANSVISLYSSYHHKLLAVGSLCISCGDIDQSSMHDEESQHP
ncbi:MAG: hypothetical protein JRN21_09780 [Nitrososphaerota archaeon]|nr:hypothetical protein [Nitrososphaerota archaeon]